MERISDNILTFKGLNTLLFHDPFAKLCFTSFLTSYYKKTIYIDLDTTYTAYSNAGFIRNYSQESIILFTPNEMELEDLSHDIIYNLTNSSLVIFDSINSFYNLYYKKIDMSSLRGISSIQHTLSNFLMLLLKYCKYLQIPLLVTSMMRYRKKRVWIKTPVNKRFLETKSNVILSVQMFYPNNISVEVLKHPYFPSRGIFLKNSEVSICQ